MTIGQFHPVIGGAERQALALARALAGKGHTVSVLTTWNPRTSLKRERIDGIRVERVWYPILQVFGYRIGLGFLAPLFMFWRAYRAARDCDVIHAHQCLWPAFAAAVAARIRRKPIVCKIGNSGERFDLDMLRHTHWYGRLAAWYVKRAVARFVWTSRAVHDDLVREGITETKLIHIPNGVVIPEKRLSADGDPAVFIFSGTFTAKKNVFALLDAVRVLSPLYHEKMKCILLGDGPDRKAFADAVRDQHVEEIIALPGAVDDVAPFLRQSDVFVLPSFNEGLSNSALEAMAHGLPLIVSDRGGNRDLVDGNGMLVDPNNIQSLADAMRFMIEHPSERRRLGERSRQIAYERYAMEKVAGAYEKLYRSVL